MKYFLQSKLYPSDFFTSLPHIQAMELADLLGFTGSSVFTLCIVLNHLPNGLLSIDHGSDLQEDSTSKISVDAEWKYDSRLGHEP